MLALATLAIMVGVLSAGCSPMLWTSGVPNLDTVDGRLMRGGQPTREGWMHLRAEGVSTVITLHTAAEASDAYAESIGLRVLHFDMAPGSAADVFGAPDLETLHEVVEAIDTALGVGGVYVHCAHGQDRTGLVVGAWRVWHDRWTWAQAYAEARAHHFHPALLGLRLRWRQL